MFVTYIALPETRLNVCPPAWIEPPKTSKETSPLVDFQIERLIDKDVRGADTGDADLPEMDLAVPEPVNSYCVPATNGTTVGACFARFVRCRFSAALVCLPLVSLPTSADFPFTVVVVVAVDWVVVSLPAFPSSRFYTIDKLYCWIESAKPTCWCLRRA